MTPKYRDVRVTKVSNGFQLYFSDRKGNEDDEHGYAKQLVAKTRQGALDLIDKYLVNTRPKAA